METFITEDCKKNINFDYIFDEIKPITKYGVLAKKNAKPFLPGQEDELLVELKKVEGFLNTPKRRQVIDILKEVRYIQETLQRAKNNITLDLIELFEIKKYIIYLEKLEKSLRGTLLSTYDDLKIKPLPHLYKLLDPAGQKLLTFYIYDEYSENLREIRHSIRQTEKSIKVIQKEIKVNIEAKYNIKFNLRDEVTVNKIQSNLIESLNNEENLRAVGENYLSIIYGIKNNLQIDNFKQQLQGLKEEEDKEELEIRKYLTQNIKKSYEDLTRNSEKVGRIDYLIAKANFAQKTNSVMPQITKDLIIDIKDGRNLKLANMLKQKKKDYTPISVCLNKNVVCITGANMGGKTISLRMVGQIISAVAYGMFVPCESAKVCLFKHIHISVGDDQSIEKGLSTFGAEIVNLKVALENAGERSLILIDELAGGTNPKEGFAITKAVVEYLKNSDSLSIFTTHYDNIANDKDVQNLQVAGLNLPEGINEFTNIEDISKYMNYSLVEVKDQSKAPKDALNIAKIAGIPDEIINRAMSLVANSK
ncbi:DNA mismatch repair protein MutS [Sedimentibacter sp. zth1]|uniref:lysine 5,6-aminomutase reactivase ATPase KamC n=1 Tax=Sedimentibacter sp. zth1 TaxID=2816908 RepID=UPI001A91CEEC|nr:DNA mismatch repair protein MutS [Sedimentibacter sp. zth1]QSX05260.1 DNA mismatch repair protein MutS [Sedimentibacter sp. zth1]